MRRGAREIEFQKGLTLIEILVVMAIILMLAGITHKGDEEGGRCGRGK